MRLIGYVGCPSPDLAQRGGLILQSAMYNPCMKKLIAPVTAAGIALIGPLAGHWFEVLPNGVILGPLAAPLPADAQFEGGSERIVEMPTRGPIGNTSRGFIESTLDDATAAFRGSSSS